MLEQLLGSPSASLVGVAGGVLMLLNAVAAGWLLVRPLRHVGGSASESEGTAA